MAESSGIPDDGDQGCLIVLMCGGGTATDEEQKVRKGVRGMALGRDNIAVGDGERRAEP